MSKKIVLSGYNSKLSLELDLSIWPNKKINCIDKIEHSSCVHLKDGYCQNTLVYHYCKHINFANPINLKILQDNNFEKADGFNQKTNIDSIIDSYSINIKDLFTKSKYMFPQFASKHNNFNYIALGFVETLDKPTPMIIGGNNISYSNQSLDFNSLFVMDNVLTHYSFFVKYNELYLNYFSSAVQPSIDLFMFEPIQITSTSNDISKRILKKDYFDTNLSKLYNYFAEYLIEKFKKYLSEECLDKDNDLSGYYDINVYYETLNIFEYLIKKFNMTDFEFSKTKNINDKPIIKTNIESQKHESIINQFKCVNKNEIIRKLKAQPQSIYNYLKNTKDAEIESRVLFEFKYFYSLLQLRACNYIPSNNSDPTLEQMINEFYSLNSVFENLAKEFL